MATPFLTFPVAEENNPEINHLCLYSLKDNKPYTLNLLQSLTNFQCVGSSDGWLAYLDEKANPFLLNPFSRTRVYLPSKHTLGWQSLSSSSKIQNVVFSVKNSAVVVIYSYGYHRSRIAFCRLGDEVWRDLDCKGEAYYDAVCCDQKNMVFALGQGPLVESWDFNPPVPKKRMMIRDSLEVAAAVYPSDLYTSQWYFALSLGQIYLVVRYIGEFVRHDAKVMSEWDTLTDYAAEPLVCPYKTIDFHVFKLHIVQKKLIRVKSLNGCALFLGGNQSMMVSTIEHPELKANAIYFTDDYWERFNEDYTYGGHDIGIFSLEHGSIEQILHRQHQKYKPPPFWISFPPDYK